MNKCVEIMVVPKDSLYPAVVHEFLQTFLCLVVETNQIFGTTYVSVGKFFNFEIFISSRSVLNSLTN